MNCKDLNIMCPACDYSKTRPYHDPYTDRLDFPFRCWILRGEQMFEGKSNQEVRIELYNNLHIKYLSQNFIQFIINYRYPQYKDLLNKMLVLL